MRCTRAAGLVLIALIAMSAVGAATAQAEEPYWRVKGARLKAGGEREFVLSATKSYVIRGTLESTKFAFTCTATEEAGSPGVIIGSEPEHTAKDVGPVKFILRNCTKTEILPECWKTVEEIQIETTKSLLVTWQDSKGHNVTGELLEPLSSQLLLEITIEGPGCPKEYDPKVTGTIVGGFALEGVPIEVGKEKEALAPEFFFPAESVKEATLEGVKRKVGLTFAGAPLTIEGRSTMKLLSGEACGAWTK
jgi:hypothetical protein